MVERPCTADQDAVKVASWLSGTRELIALQSTLYAQLISMPAASHFFWFDGRTSKRKYQLKLISPTSCKNIQDQKREYALYSSPVCLLSVYVVLFLRRLKVTIAVAYNAFRKIFNILTGVKVSHVCNTIVSPCLHPCWLTCVKFFFRESVQHSNAILCTLAKEIKHSIAAMADYYELVFIT